MAIGEPLLGWLPGSPPPPASGMARIRLMMRSARDCPSGKTCSPGRKGLSDHAMAVGNQANAPAGDGDGLSCGVSLVEVSGWYRPENAKCELKGSEGP